MENASKALVMAGGVLIGVMLASFFVLVIRRGAQMNAEYEQQAADNQLTKFNSQFELYDRKYDPVSNTGAETNNTFFDVITVANMAYDVNKRNSWDENTGIRVVIETKATGIAIPGVDDKYSIIKKSFGSNLPKNYFFIGEPASESAAQNSGQWKFMYDNELISKLTESRNSTDTDVTAGKAKRQNAIIYRYYFNAIMGYSGVTGRVDDIKFTICANNNFTT